MKGARQRLDREEQDMRWLAWQIAALNRTEKLPSAKSYLSEQSVSSEPQSPEVLFAMGKALARAWGAEEVT